MTRLATYHMSECVECGRLTNNAVRCVDCANWPPRRSSAVTSPWVKAALDGRLEPSAFGAHAHRTTRR